MSVKRLVSLNAAALASDPANPIAGDFYYNTVQQVLRYYNGTSWNPIGGASAGQGIEVVDGAFNVDEGFGLKFDAQDKLAVDDTVMATRAWVQGSTELFQDAIDDLFVHAYHTNITATYDDVNNRIILEGSSSGSSTGAGANLANSWWLAG
jgi:hypothetical protein